MPEIPQGDAAGTPQAGPTAAAAKDVIDQVLDQSTKEKLAVVGRAKTDSQRALIERQVGTLIQEVVEGHVQRTEALDEALDVAIARLDRVLTDQVNLFLHHPEVQKVESTWRGLHYLVHQSETGEMLKIRVLDASKKDLADDLMKASEFDQSGLFKAIYTSEYSTPGGTPYGALIGDYFFGNNDPDLALMEKIAEVSAASHAPFFAAPDPTILGLDSYTQLMEPRDLAKKFEGADYARWRSLRKKPESVYVGLVLPRVLGRLPYGEKTDPVDAFRFQEDAEGQKHGNYLWMNSAWAMGARLTDAHSKFGFCTAITGKDSGNGVVAGLPVHSFRTADGTIDAKCPTEIGMDERRGAELEKLGFIPLLHWKNTDFAAFVSAQSINKPDEYFDPAATANADLMAQLPYVMAVSRFAHYIKVMMRDKLGTFMERVDVERELRNWIANYVLLNPEGAGQELKAQKPLAAASVEVVDVPGKPGQYRAVMLLRPHFMLKKIDVSLRLVASLEKKG